MPLAVAALEEWHAETFKHAGKLKAPYTRNLRPHTLVYGVPERLHVQLLVYGALRFLCMQP